MVICVGLARVPLAGVGKSLACGKFVVFAVVGFVGSFCRQIMIAYWCKSWAEYWHRFWGPH